MTARGRLEVGEVRSGRPLTLSLARVLSFSGGPIDAPNWPERNLHTDPAKAREAGLAHLIASGTQSEGMLIGFLITSSATTGTRAASWMSASSSPCR